ncbi:uncharacterized protein ACNS7B_010360 isoform 2-T2 [Menidia menidia]
MDALSKTAVMEIGKLVEIESKMWKIEINRGRNEIASLTEKLKLMEKLLYMAQGGRQAAAPAAAAAACSVGGDYAENQVFFTPDRTRPLIKSFVHPSENLWESVGSSAEISNLHRANSHTTADCLNPQRAESELVVVKEEPPELINEDTGQEEMSDKRREVITDTQKSSEVKRHLKPTPEHQQHCFANSLLTLNPEPSLAELESEETLWTSHVVPAHTDLGNGKSLAQNVAPQNVHVLRNIKHHNFRNSAAKKFGCLQCGKSFRCFSQLEIHQRSHTGEKPFRCTLCGKRYAQKGHLYTHQRTHTGEKPYRCPICGKGFIQKCTLDMHQRTHTGEKPFVCPKCGKGFTKNCNLKKHFAVHLDGSLNDSEGPEPAFGGIFTSDNS